MIRDFCAENLVMSVTVIVISSEQTKEKLYPSPMLRLSAIEMTRNERVPEVC